MSAMRLVLVAGFSAARIWGPPRNSGQAATAVGGDTSFANRLSPKFGGTRQPVRSRRALVGYVEIRRSILTPALTPAPRNSNGPSCRRHANA